MMDCVLPTRNARNGSLFTSEGKVVIKQARYGEDQVSARSGLQLLHLPDLYTRLSSPPVSGGEILFSTLGTLHNIHYFLELMRGMRGTLSYLRASVLARYLDHRKRSASRNAS